MLHALTWPPAAQRMWYVCRCLLFLSFSPVTVTMMYWGELLWPLLFWIAECWISVVTYWAGVVRTTAFWLWAWVGGAWGRSASCPVFEAVADWLAEAMVPEVGGISGRKCAGLEDEGVVAAGVAMVTVLACWGWRSSEYPEVAMATNALRHYSCG